MRRFHSLGHRLPALLVTSMVGIGIAAPAAKGEAPRFTLVDETTLADVRHRLDAGDEELQEALKSLIKGADKALNTPVAVITDKPQVPPSGDKRDYMSLSPYWWPNPDTQDGLPYVWRDGEFNPERDKFDLPKLEAVADAVRDLGPAYHFTGDEKYAAHAAKLLRAFFLDPQTGMNPNLKYAQFRPGHTMEHHGGIIETNRFRWMIDAVTMLEPSEAWTEADHEGMKTWFRGYLDWLQTSEQGRREAQSENNHGTWYASQVVQYALFVGDTETAKRVLDTVPARIDAQIEPDGSQPHELRRTNAFHYTDFNLRALVDLGHMGRRVGVDLFSYEAPDGSSIRKGIEWLIPYALNQKEFTYKQISERKLQNVALLLRMASRGYNDPRYEQLIAQLPGKPKLDTRVRLMMPAIPAGTAASAQ